MGAFWSTRRGTPTLWYFVLVCCLLFLTIDSTVPSSNSQQSKIIQQVPNVQNMFDRCLALACLLNSLETANDGNPIVYWILIKKRHKNRLSIQSVFPGLLNTRTLERYEKKPPRRKRSKVRSPRSPLPWIGTAGWERWIYLVIPGPNKAVFGQEIFRVSITFSVSNLVFIY